MKSYRDQRGLPLVETLIRDSRLALRRLGMAPAFHRRNDADSGAGHWRHNIDIYSGACRSAQVAAGGQPDELYRVGKEAHCCYLAGYSQDKEFSLVSYYSRAGRATSPTSLGGPAQLPILTLGSQFQGGNNITIGQRATLDVFVSVSELVNDHIQKEDARTITIKNASGRKVVIALASDPDIRIQEEFDGQLRNKVAIEIKGGTDISNAHNRAGEAEKSHQKAKKQGFRDYWTIISKAGLNVEKPYKRRANR